MPPRIPLPTFHGASIYLIPGAAVNAERLMGRPSWQPGADVPAGGRGVEQSAHTTCRSLAGLNLERKPGALILKIGRPQDVVQAAG